MHGDFIFADMAVPIIEQEGVGKRSIDFKLTMKQAEQIWEMLGTSLSISNKNIAEQPDTLEILINNQPKLFTIEKKCWFILARILFRIFEKWNSFEGTFQRNSFN